MKKQIFLHDKRVMLYLKNQDWLKIRKQKDKRRRRVLEKLWHITKVKQNVQLMNKK